MIWLPAVRDRPTVAISDARPSTVPSVVSNDRIGRANSPARTSSNRSPARMRLRPRRGATTLPSLADPAADGRGRHLGQLAVDDPDFALGAGGDVAVVGDQAHRQAAPHELVEQLQDRLVLAESRLPVGSSHNRIDGSTASARATATR